MRLTRRNTLAGLAGMASACAARADPYTVTVYSFTSRIQRVKAAFQEANPGWRVDAVDLSSSRAIARLIAEQDAGQPRADVVYLGDAPVVINRLLREGRVLGYAPERLHSVLARKHQAPLLVQRISTKVLLYNSALHPRGAPVANLWELAQPPWRGRFALVDPTQRGDYLDLLTEFTLQGEAFAAAHRSAFGADIANAGVAFVQRLLSNDPVILASTEALNNAIGGARARQALVGFGTYSDLRDNQRKGRALEAAARVEPMAGISYPVILALTAQAPNPEGGRKLIDFMMGDASPTGGEAYKPFYTPGDYPARTDIAPPPGAPALTALNLWPIDPARIADARRGVANLAIRMLG